MRYLILGQKLTGSKPSDASPNYNNLLDISDEQTERLSDQQKEEEHYTPLLQKKILTDILIKRIFHFISSNDQEIYDIVELKLPTRVTLISFQSKTKKKSQTSPPNAKFHSIITT